jgi:hypothetical protein
VAADIDFVLDRVVIRLESLDLDLDGTLVPVAKGKQPRQGEGETSNTQILVCPAADPKRARRFTNIHELHTYRLMILLWTPGNFDNTALMTELAELEDTIAQAFDVKPADLMGLDDLRDVRSDTDGFIPRGPFVQGWDVLALAVEVDIVRERSAA